MLHQVLLPFVLVPRRLLSDDHLWKHLFHNNCTALSNSVHFEWNDTTIRKAVCVFAAVESIRHRGKFEPSGTVGDVD